MKSVSIRVRHPRNRLVFFARRLQVMLTAVAVMLVLGLSTAIAANSNGTLSTAYVTDNLCLVGPNKNTNSAALEMSFGSTTSGNGDYVSLSFWYDHSNIWGSIGTITPDPGQFYATDTITYSVDINSVIGSTYYIGLLGAFTDAGIGRNYTTSPLSAPDIAVGTGGVYHLGPVDMSLDPDCALPPRAVQLEFGGAESAGAATPANGRSFATAVVGAAPVTRTFTLRSIGNGPVNVTSISTTGDADFTASAFNGTVSTTDTFTVTFTPTTGGTRNANLVIQNNGTGTITVPLVGEGQFAPLGLSLSPTSLSLTRGVAMTPLVPNSTGGSGGNVFTVSPALPSGLDIDAENGTISGTPDVYSPTSVYTITVTDSSASSDHEILDLQIDHPALGLGLSQSTQTLTRGLAMTAVTAAATGGDETYNFSISPALPSGLSMAANGTISGTPDTASPPTSYDVTVTDGTNTTETASITLEVIHPTLTLTLSETALTLTRDSAMTPVTATAGGGDESYSFSVSPALPSGLSMAANGTISGTPDTASPPTSYDVTVTDGTNTTETASITLEVIHPALTLTLSETALTLTRDSAMTPVTATAGGGDESYSFSVSPALPSGLSMAANGTISGTPDTASPPTSYDVTVTDGTNATETASITLEVAHAALTLSLSETALSTTRGTAIVPIVATPGGGDGNYSFSITPALPGGLTMDASGTISGTPNTASPATQYTVTVSDGAAATQSATVTIAVSNPALALILSQTSLALTRGIDMPVVTATATGGDESYSFSVTPALPPGLSMDASGTISGAPGTTSPATSYTVMVTDGTAATQSATIAIAVANPALAFSLSEISLALTRGVDMPAVTATTTGGDGSYSFSVTPVLPPGLSIDALGTISGTPSAASPATSYTVTVTDGATATQAATISIAVANPALTLVLSETSLTLRRGVTMPPVTATATGGDGTYTFAISPALPTGLTMNAAGVIAGTPDAASPVTAYLVTVSDGSGASQTATIELEIVENPLELTLSENALTLTRNIAMTPVTAVATGGGETYAFSVSPALPPGLSMIGSTISGTPTGTQTIRTYTLTVTDGAAASQTATLTIEVLENIDHVAEAFTDTTASFIANRMDRILSSEPGAYRFENRGNSGLGMPMPQASASNIMTLLSGSHASEDASTYAWFEGRFSRYTFADGPFGGVGTFATGAAGIDYLLNPSLAAGVMVEFDHASETADDYSDVSGNGWMIGPYLTGKLAPEINFTLRASLGASQNLASIGVFSDGTPWYMADFRTTRALVKGSIYGRHDFEGGFSLSPELTLSWMGESQSDYQASNGITTVDIAGVTIDVGRATFSMLAEMPVGDNAWILFAKPALDWNFSGSSVATSEPLRGSLELGLRTGEDADWNAAIGLRLDGIGSTEMSGQSAKINIGKSF